MLKKNCLAVVPEISHVHTRIHHACSVSLGTAAATLRWHARGINSSSSHPFCASRGAGLRHQRCSIRSARSGIFAVVLHRFAHHTEARLSSLFYLSREPSPAFFRRRPPQPRPSAYLRLHYKQYLRLPPSAPLAWTAILSSTVRDVNMNRHAWLRRHGRCALALFSRGCHGILLGSCQARTFRFTCALQAVALHSRGERAREPAIRARDTAR